MNRIEKSLIATDDEKGWIHQITDMLNVSPCACFRVHPEDVDAIPASVPLLCRIGSDVRVCGQTGMLRLRQCEHRHGEGAFQKIAAGVLPHGVLAIHVGSALSCAGIYYPI
jgi:hypothetical protein